MVTLADEQQGNAAGETSLWGDLLCILSSCLYAVYTTVLKKKLPDAHGASVASFLGYIGLFSAIALAPVVLGGWLLGALPLGSISKESMVLILVEGLLDYVVSDYLWALAVIILGPTIATLGLSIQIPVAALVDYLVHGPKATTALAAWISRIGTLLILTGFVGINSVGGGSEEDATDGSQCSPPAGQIQAARRRSSAADSETHRSSHPYTGGYTADPVNNQASPCAHAQPGHARTSNGVKREALAYSMRNNADCSAHAAGPLQQRQRQHNT